jgi:hypothetical protein
VFELIAGFTGLSYSVNESGVYVWNSAGPGGAGSGSQDPVVAMMRLPDSGIEIMIRTSDTGDDLRQYILHRKRQELDKLREAMKKEGFVPTTQPAPPAAATQKDEKPKDL